MLLPGLHWAALFLEEEDSAHTLVAAVEEDSARTLAAAVEGSSVCTLVAAVEEDSVCTLVAAAEEDSVRTLTEAHCSCLVTLWASRTEILLPRYCRW